MNFRRFIKTTLVFIIVVLATRNANANLLNKAFDGFYTVEKGKLYRSAQLKPKRLEYYIKRFGIKTIINLRGENPEHSWWHEEKAVAERNSIQFYNIPMSAKELTPKHKLIELLNIYDSAPTPILIHCLHGRDRTGEAAALWVYEKINAGTRQALKQLSLIPHRHSQLRYPAKSFLIRIWNGRDWLMNTYDETQFPQFAK